MSKQGTTTQNSMDINATPQTLYKAFTNAAALEAWLAPGEMTGKLHNFDLRIGGGYSMSLYYPQSEKEAKGKTAEKEDRYASRFLELTPFKKIVQAITFNSSNPAFAGEMIMEVSFEQKRTKTKVNIIFRNIPPGIRPEDNEAGTQLSLEKLKRYVKENIDT